MKVTLKDPFASLSGSLSKSDHFVFRTVNGITYMYRKHRRSKNHSTPAKLPSAQNEYFRARFRVCRHRTLEILKTTSLRQYYLELWKCNPKRTGSPVAIRSRNCPVVIIRCQK